MERFNGWTNWDTWNAHLWLSNEEPLYYSMRHAARRGLQRFEVVARDMLVGIGNPDGIDLDAVDWEEVYEAFDEE